MFLKKQYYFECVCQHHTLLLLQPKQVLETWYNFFMTKSNVKVLQKESYVACIRNSVGTKMFQEYYARVDGKKKEVVENGNKSCALYASSILYLFGLVSSVQPTVHRMLSDMGKSGWVIIKRPKIGCIILWEEKMFGDNNPRKHVGFYIGNGKAISNSSAKRVPCIHDYTSFDGRGIQAMFWHPKLNR
jgi:hypothetical protein